jgi:hypothetical protein
MTWKLAFEEIGSPIVSRHDLLSVGATARGLTAGVRLGYLLRVRRDHYALPGTARPILEAVRVGGRLGCLSALDAAGAFVADATFTHVHLTRDASRLRHPRNRFVPLNLLPRDGVELHWAPLIDPTAGSEIAVGIPDALAQIARCQHPWHAIASIDSALHLGLIATADLAPIFATLPAHLQYLRRRVDGRAEAGQESVLRMIVHEAGLDYEVQVSLPGVGRVDLVVEGCLILEADSRKAHDGWELHVRDRDRDIAAAQLGYMSLRPVYQRTMYSPMDVRAAILHLLAVNRHFRRVL